LSNLYKYIELLTKWQPKIRLVGSLQEVSDHVDDARALLEHIPAGSRLIDVGSGAGLPGVVIAIERPDVRVTALEPIHKKHAFLRTVRRELRLENFQAHAERDEQHLVRDDFAEYDVAVSRATFGILEWLDRARHLVTADGVRLALEGDPLAALPTGATRHPYTVGGRHRAVVVLPGQS
jgi:16S rRNA (guanine527-N7)-methyltransferase